MINIGSQLYTFRNVLKNASDLKGVFGLLREEGGGSAQLSGLKFEYDAAECRALAADYGIVLPLTHTPWEKILHDTDKVIKDHLALGAVMVGLGMMPMNYRSAEGLKTFASEVNSVSAKLKEAGLSFGYHNHAFEFTKTVAPGKRIFDFLKEECPDIHFIFDTYWCYFAGYDPVKELEGISGRARCIHLKDGIKFWKFPIITAVGDGKSDFGAIMSAAEAAGTEYAFIEHDFAKDPAAITSKSLAFLHQIYRPGEKASSDPGSEEA